MTVKEMLKKSSDPYLEILAYRTTPIQGGKYSPAELLMNRVLRSTVPTTREQRAPKVPDPKEVRVRDMNVKLRQKKNFDTHHGVRHLPTVEPGVRVWIPAREVEATVDSEVAPRSLQVTTDEGSELRRNRRDMITLPTEQSEKTHQEPEPQNSAPPNPRRSSRISVPPTRFAPYVEH